MQHNDHLQSAYESANAPLQYTTSQQPSQVYFRHQQQNYHTQPQQQQQQEQRQEQIPSATQQVPLAKQPDSMPFYTTNYQSQFSSTHANGFVNGRHDSGCSSRQLTDSFARAQMMHQCNYQQDHQQHQQQRRHHTNCHSLATQPPPLSPPPLSQHHYQHHNQHQQQQQHHQSPQQQANYHQLTYDQVAETCEPERVSYLPPNYTLNHFNLEPDLANAHARQNYARQCMLMDEQQQQQYMSQASDYDYCQEASPSSYYCPTPLDQQQHQQQQVVTYQMMSPNYGLSSEPASPVKLREIVATSPDDNDGGGGEQDSGVPATLAGRVETPSDDMARAMEDSVGLAKATSGAAPAGSAFSADWLDSICRQVIEHMNRYGICVIDNFFGNEKGNAIYEEVRELYETGGHISGRLVNDRFANGNSASSVDAIRNDRVIWISGAEDGCSKINGLIQTLCSVVTNSIRLSLYSNNALDNIVINRRTKAHVACYPGNGTRYVKHVDNPNGDGRLITAIYYVNKNWSVKHEGGLLRMYPSGMNEVANIEPLFDRVLFFWSDRRNPHEVLPAYRDRFAITVWFMGQTRPRD